MFPFIRSWSVLILLIGAHAVPAQYDDLAMAGTRSGDRALNKASIAFLETDAPGVVRLALPVGTERVDLLNARGKVVRQLDGPALPFLDLGSLKPGSWTLRAHTPNGFQIRRFLVLADGHMYWSPPRTGSRRGH